MADLSKKTIFPNAENNPLEYVKGKSSQFFTGIDDLINHKFTKLVTGYAYIYWVRLPSWFDRDDDLKYFKAISEKNFLSLQGLSTVTLSTASYNIGMAGNEASVATGIERGNTQFTIEHNEYSGSPMRKLYQKWVSYIRDPRTGIAPYCKLFGVDYSQGNHTGELLYMTVRPDANNGDADILEFAIYFSNVMPTTFDLSLYNYTRGTQDSPTYSAEFTGVPDFGPYVDDYARYVLKNYILNDAVDMDGGYRNLTTYGADETTKQVANAGSLQSIYNRDAE